MNCPHWRSLSSWRQTDGAAPAGWGAALEHLAGCERCRQAAAELDPTLLLVAAAAPVPAAVDQKQLRASVHALRRSTRLEARSRTVRRPLAAAAVLLALLSVPLALRWLGPAAPATAPPPESLLVTVPGTADEPLIEDVLPPRARVYQFGSDELPVVLIVDENLDF